MKKLILLGALLASSTVFAKTQIHNYDEIVSSINNGIPLHIVTNFAQCSATNKSAATVMSAAYFSPKEIGVTDTHVATALTHFTMNDPLFPGRGVNEYVRYTITPDKTVKVILNVLDPVTYNTLIDPITFTCKLDEATKIFV